MSWVRIDDHFYDHPKWADAPGDSIALWVAAMAWCNRNSQFDGRIPANKLHGLVSIRNVKSTVVDLVTRRAFIVDGTAYLIHEYPEYQQNDKVRKIREVRSAAGKKGAAARWESEQMTNMANDMANGCQTEGQTDGNENAPPPTTHLTLISDNPPTAVTPPGGDLSSRINAAADAYAEHAYTLAIAKGRNIKAPDTWKGSAKTRICGGMEISRLCREYPTAPPDTISAHLHGESSSLHLHERVSS